MLQGKKFAYVHGMCALGACVQYLRPQERAVLLPQC